MTAQSSQLADAAQLLHDAQRSSIPISPLTQTYPNLDVARAYSVQRLNLARLGTLTAVDAARSQDRADLRPMQELLGVSEPDFGYILDSTVLPNGAAAPVTAFWAPRVEPEDAGTARRAGRDRTSGARKALLRLRAVNSTMISDVTRGSMYLRASPVTPGSRGSVHALNTGCLITTSATRWTAEWGRAVIFAFHVSRIDRRSGVAPRLRL